jgi:hypothetical protein
MRQPLCRRSANGARLRLRALSHLWLAELEPSATLRFLPHKLGRRRHDQSAQTALLDKRELGEFVWRKTPREFLVMWSPHMLNSSRVRPNGIAARIFQPGVRTRTSSPIPFKIEQEVRRQRLLMSNQYLR